MVRWLAAVDAVVAIAGVVAVVGSTTHASSPSSSSAAGSPVARPAAVGALALRPADPTATDLSRYRVVILNAWEWPRIAAIKRAHADTLVFVYKDMASTRSYAVHNGADDALLPTGVGYTAAKASHPEWFLRDTHGRLVEWSGYHDHWWMDVGNAAYADTWLASVTAEVSTHGWDGVMIDNAIIDPAVYLPGGSTLATYPTASSYQAATGAFLARVAPALRAAGRTVVVNLGGAVPPPDLYRTWVGATGGVMREHFARGGSDGKGELVAGDDWRREVEQQELAAAAGARYVAVTYASPSDTSFLAYARASFLLGWDGDARSSLIVVSPEPRTDPWSATWTTDIGTPLAGRRASGTAWVRRFTHGFAAVNPSLVPVHVEVDGHLVALAPHAGAVVRTR